MYTLHQGMGVAQLQYQLQFSTWFLLTRLIYIGNEFAIYFINLQCQTAKTLDAVKGEKQKEIETETVSEREREKGSG